MKVRKDISHQKFGLWTTGDVSECVRKSGKLSWKCTCVCGEVSYHPYFVLANNKSNGCRKCHSDKQSINNGDSRKVSKYRGLYISHNCMVKRCHDSKDKSYEYYGAKGVSVCSEWIEYLDFKKWALDNGWEDGLVISRNKDVGNYCPDNVKWETKFKNSSDVNRGKKGKRKLSDVEVAEIRSATISKNGVAEVTRITLAKKYGVSMGTIAGIRAGWLYKDLQ